MYSQSFPGKTLRNESKSFLQPLPKYHTEPPPNCFERFFCPRATMENIFAKALNGDLGYYDKVNTQGEDGMTALFAAAYMNETKAMERLILVGADPDLPDDYLQTPLFVATFQGHANAVEILLKAKSDPNLPQENGMTPLAIACGKGHFDVVKLLLEYGACANYPMNELKWTALHIAASKGFTDIVEILMKHGAKFDLESKNNLNFLCFLSQQLSETDNRQIERLLTAEHPEVLLNFIYTIRNSQKMIQTQAYDEMIEFMKGDLVKEKLTPIITTSKSSTPKYFSPQNITTKLKFTLPSFSSPRLLTPNKLSPVKLSSVKKIENKSSELKAEEKRLSLSPTIA